MTRSGHSLVPAGRGGPKPGRCTAASNVSAESAAQAVAITASSTLYSLLSTIYNGLLLVHTPTDPTTL